LFGLRDWASTSKMVRGGCSSQWAIAPPPPLTHLTHWILIASLPDSLEINSAEASPHMDG
jgi:hypothetical protein